MTDKVNKTNSLDKVIQSFSNPKVTPIQQIEPYIQGRNFVIACRYGILEEIKQNIDKIQDINMKLRNGHTFLSHAVIGDHLDVFKTLLYHPSIDSYCTSIRGMNVLHISIMELEH